MSWDYLQGSDSKSKTWAEVTRDERFFCQHLYHLILRKPDIRSFVRDLKGLTDDKLNLNAGVDWEIGYEVCFYRDLMFHRKVSRDSHCYSLKRTFDLCLFSEETIVIIEAKAQQRFDAAQNKSFILDKGQVSKLTGGTQVKLLGLASSKYLDKKSFPLPPTENAVFDGLISWEQLAKHFDNDKILERANRIYGRGEPDPADLQLLRRRCSI